MKVEIVPVGGSPVPIHHHNGEMFAEAPASGDYVIRLTNSTPDRVEAVLSVDGIDACNGKDANFSNRGWVLHAWQTIDIQGWFRTHAEVAAFQFAKAGSGKGYAEKTGRGTEHVGVIGVAVFKEKLLDPLWILMQQQSAAIKEPSPWIQASGWRGGGNILRNNAVYGSSGGMSHCSTKGIPTASVESTYTVNSSDEGSCDVKCSVTMDAAPSDISTGYGKKTEMHSSSVNFTRASETPHEVLSLRYATRTVLKSWGVPLHATTPPAPNPFPGNPGVPAPTGWRG